MTVIKNDESTYKFITGNNTLSKPISKLNTPGNSTPVRRNMKRNNSDVFNKLYEVEIH
jgi:hypothetical protein